MLTDSELKLYYVLPSGHWEIKAQPQSNPVAAFRNHEDARRYLDSKLEEMRKPARGKDPHPQV